MSNFLATNRQIASLTLTLLVRRKMVWQAMCGASVYEQRVLVRVALECLSSTEQTALVRDLDREQWKQLKV